MITSRASKGRKIVYLVTEDWFFCSHFIGRAKAAAAKGFDVAVLTRVSNHGDTIREAGIELVPLRMSRQSRNPLREFLAVLEVRRHYKRLQPSLVHHYAVKPILYGTLAAKLARVPHIVNAPVGMGFVYGSESGLARLLRPALALGYRFLLNPVNSRVIFENPDDLEMLACNGSVDRSRARLIRGAGVDLDDFLAVPEPATGPVKVLLVSRMLVEKGVREFVEAARRIQQAGHNARFVLVGEPDPDNPNSVTRRELQAWHDSGDVEWLGRRNDIPDLLAESHIACLPSFYREGLPKTLLEAAASGRPIVTTDMPGCREAVHHGENGLLVPPRDLEALVAALVRLIEDSELRRTMGARGRERAVREFSLPQVDRETLEVYAEMVLA